MNAREIAEELLEFTKNALAIRETSFDRKVNTLAQAYLSLLKEGVVVPVDPTEKMLEKMREVHWEIRGCQLCEEDYRDIYKAMIASKEKV